MAVKTVFRAGKHRARAQAWKTARFARGEASERVAEWEKLGRAHCQLANKACSACHAAFSEESKGDALSSVQGSA